MCQDEQVFGLEDIQESGSHIDWEAVHRMEEHRCKE